MRTAFLGILLTAGVTLCPAAQTPSGTVDAVRSLLREGRYDAAETSADVVLTAARDRYGGDSIEAADAGDLLVEARWHNGRWTSDTRALAERIVRTRESHLGQHDRKLAASIRNLGEVLLRSGDSPGAVVQFERALALLRASPNVDSADAGDALDGLAAALLQSGRHADAVD